MMQIKLTKELMEDKNHDYGEVWRDAYQFLTDLILQKLLRVQIENNKGKQLSQKVLTPIIRT
jgi:hypothetical protein